MKGTSAPESTASANKLESLKPGDIVVPGIGIGGDFPDLGHHPRLPVHRKPGMRLNEGFCGDDHIHPSIVTVSNLDQTETVTHGGNMEDADGRGRHQRSGRAEGYPGDVAR